MSKETYVCQKRHFFFQKRPIHIKKDKRSALYVHMPKSPIYVNKDPCMSTKADLCQITRTAALNERIATRLDIYGVFLDIYMSLVQGVGGLQIAISAYMCRSLLIYTGLF